MNPRTTAAIDCPIIEQSMTRTILKSKSLERCAAEPLPSDDAPSNKPMAPSTIKGPSPLEREKIRFFDIAQESKLKDVLPEANS